MFDASTSTEGQDPRGKPERGTVITDEAVRHVDIIHTSLTGMTGIVFMLLFAIALPVFGRPPVTQPLAFFVMAATAMVGIAGLYILNYRVHKHVTNQARLTQVLVNSLGQGFAVFGSDGVCESVYSQACNDLLETVPMGKPIAQVLRLSETETGDFNEWLGILFQRDHALGFDDVVCFFPKFFAHTQGRRISLVYRPIVGHANELVKVVVIATDQTDEYAAKQTAERQQNFAEMICRIFRDRNQFQSTLAHVRDFVEQSNAPGVSFKDSTVLLRELHTLKAAAKQFNLLDLSEIIHTAENDLRAPEVKTDDVFVERLKVDSEKIGKALAAVRDEVSALIGMEGEWHGAIREIGEKDLYTFAEELKQKNTDPALLQTFLRTIVAVPIQDCFRAFERELYDLAGMMDKQIKPLRFMGTNPPVLAQPMQEFLFSLTHMCRNIVDHGIETPVTRMARGKEAAGTVSIECGVVPNKTGPGEMLRIVIADDGNGIDPSRVRTKLGTLDPDGVWRNEDDQTVIQRIFTWGFTTAETVTTLSGRGVGMEAVLREVTRLGGSMHVFSELYKGSTFEILLPYKLALPSEADSAGKEANN